MSGEPGARGQVEPGWYPDPAGEDLERYWDGAKWTERVRSERDEAKASQPRQTAAPRRDAGGGDTASFVRRNGPKIVAGVAALVLVGGGIALVVTGGESDEGSAGSQDESVESETGPPPATLPVLRDDETDLAESLVPSVRSSCEGVRPREQGSIASIECSTLGADYLVLESMLSQRAVNRVYEDYAGGLPEDQGFCTSSRWGVSDLWNAGGSTRGRLACEDFDDGSSQMVWTDDRRLNVAWITRDDGDHRRLFDAWSRIAN